MGDDRNPQLQVTLSPEMLSEFEEISQYLNMPVRSLLSHAIRCFHASTEFENWLGRCRRRETLSSELRQRIADAIRKGDTQEALRLLKED